MPSREDWEKAVARAGALFGLAVPQVLNAANVAKLVEGVLAKVKEVKEVIGSYCNALQGKITAYVLGGAEVPRLTTARSANALLASLTAADSAAVVGVLVQAKIDTSETAMAQTLAKAKSLDEAVRTAGWQVFEAVAKLSDHRKQAADAIKTRIAEILAADEHAIALKPALDEQHGKALKLLTDVPPPQPPQSPPPSEPPESGTGIVVVRQAQASDLDWKQARKMLDEIEQELEKDADLRLSITLRLVKKSSKA